jgi:hypothetical protein
MNKPEIITDLNLSNRDGKLFAVKSEGRYFLVLEGDTLHNAETFPGMGSTEHTEINEDAFNALANQHQVERRYSFCRPDGTMPMGRDEQLSWVTTKDEAAKIGKSYGADTILILEPHPSGKWIVVAEEILEKP